jgi:hypothetical protein
MTLQSFSILAALYWLLLLLMASGSLVFAVLAFRVHRPRFAVIAAGILAVALLVAAVPSPGGGDVFGLILGIVALALAVIGGGPMAVLALDLASHSSVPPGQHGGILVESAAAEPGTRGPEREVLRGGLIIGVLERAAVAGAILAGFPEAIAVVVAIKGVGRFTELTEAETRERFIIGTFASLIWACACAALVEIAIS